jgi:hypothetical protein
MRDNRDNFGGVVFPIGVNALFRWTRNGALSALLPGGILIGVLAVSVHSGWLALTPPALTFLYYCGLCGGLLLAWRFHSSRVFFALLLLFLARQGLLVSLGLHTSHGVSANRLANLSTVLAAGPCWRFSCPSFSAALR